MNRNNTNFSYQLFEYLKTLKFDSRFEFLKYHQWLVRNYYKDIIVGGNHSHLRGLLIYHTPGMGKGIEAAAIASDIIEIAQPIVLLTRSIRENFRLAIKKYMKMRSDNDPEYQLGKLPESDLDAYIDKKFSFVSLNASNMLDQMAKAAEFSISKDVDKALSKRIGQLVKMGNLNGKVLIIDEAQNFFRGIVNGSSNFITLYNMIMQSENCFLVFLTGTPMSNDAFEIVPCLNMLGGLREVDGKYQPLLPEHYNDFYKMFVDVRNNKIKNKEKFQNRCMGLVSHVTHMTNMGAGLPADIKATLPKMSVVEFPEKLETIVEHVPMTPEQWVIYLLARDKERDEAKRATSAFVETASLMKPRGKSSSSYRVRSRQLSNYCPPEGFRGETDLSKIPKNGFSSPKFERLYSNIMKNISEKQGLGLIYSQFVGVGGLGAFAKFLESTGEWKNFNKVDVAELARHEVISSDSGAEFSNEAPAVPIEATGGPTGANESLLHHRKFGGSTNCSYCNGKSQISDYRDKLDDEVEQKIASFNNELMKLHEDVSNTIGEITGGANAFKQHIKAVSRKGIRRITPKTAGAPILAISAGRAVGDIDEPIIPKTKDISLDPSEQTARSKSPDESLEDQVKEVTEKLEKRAETKHKVSEQGTKRAAPQKRKFIYAIMSGEVDPQIRKETLEQFNKYENRHGGIIDLLLISKSGIEGLDCKNVRHEHIMEPYWTHTAHMQFEARGIRNDAHKDLDPSERNVQVYYYLSTAPQVELSNLSKDIFDEDNPDAQRREISELEQEIRETTDMQLYKDGLKGYLLIEDFNKALQEVAIECMVNGESNCRICAPTGEKLYHSDILKDMYASDPCVPAHERTVSVTTININGKDYYWKPDDHSVFGYAVYEYSEKLNGYERMPEDNALFMKIIDAIELNKAKGGKASKGSTTEEETNEEPTTEESAK